ncbi:MAG: hypothetical protein CVU56_06350 [Deltaproteobacteria bacterium HGW-Deltaproteobacteria-14]|jgi:hypothetical protein|nr:MAG: hypothetical protein CVU56_06350 [Deltaproteobacteria bacterium HGW-Deltaproteobacteria-14]
MFHAQRLAASRLAFALTFALAGCATAPAPLEPPARAAAAPLADVTLPPLPDWTDRYAGSNDGDMRFFEIGALMERYGLTRLAAVEVQNHYRDLSRAGAEGGAEAWFSEALRRARAGDLECGRDVEARLAKAPFIVVFDLDETLWDQHIERFGGCHDVALTDASGKTRHIQRTPGWREAFERIRALGGEVVLFSANLDDPTWAALNAWTVDGIPLPAHDATIAAVLTNSYLVRQSKHEGPGRANPRRGHPVLEASKDLRLFDEALDRVIIVDDNPTRLFQPRNTRWYPAFDADAWCAGRDAGDPVATAHGVALARVVDEVEDAVRWQGEHGGTFADAYVPFTIAGRERVRFLMAGDGWSEGDAVKYVREHAADVTD